MTAPLSDLSWEDRIFNAIVGQFFAPVYSGNGGDGNPLFAQSGLSALATSMFQARRTEILNAVSEHLTADEIAEAVAERVANDIITRIGRPSSGNSFNYDPYERDRDAMRKLVNERVADELARRAIAKIDEDCPHPAPVLD